MNKNVITSEIMERITQGGESGDWLAQAAVSVYFKGVPGPSLYFYSTKLDEEAKRLYLALIDIRSTGVWDDHLFFDFANWCKGWLAKKK